jgi:predicted acetyltransferase
LTEIRPVRRSEAQDFLKLLCEAFDLDFERAKGVFFSEPMFDIDRKWACFVDGSIEAILTTVPLEFGFGRSIGIAGVATRLASRGRGLGGELLSEVLKRSDAQGEGPALLFAKERSLYERVGFQVLDTVVRAPIKSSYDGALDGVMPNKEVTSIYDDWASSKPNRLRRDERRWNYWKWNMRFCCPFANGYVCVEGTTMRECIVDGTVEGWPLHEGTEWVGLQSMARICHVPIGDETFELHLMGRGFEESPEMFMTDQF